MAFFRRPKTSKNRTPLPILNERIFFKEVFLIDENGQNIGPVSREEALKHAQAAEKDLILIAPKSNPPVVKILDFGKWQYKQKKIKARQSNKKLPLKSLRLSVRIGPGDMEVRRLAVEKFLKKGHKVKIMLPFKGREIVHVDLGFQKMQNFYATISDIAKIEDQPKKVGRQIIMILAAKNPAKKALSDTQDS